jgi:hypothetical protein
VQLCQDLALLSVQLFIVVALHVSLILRCRRSPSSGYTIILSYCTLDFSRGISLFLLSFSYGVSAVQYQVNDFEKKEAVDKEPIWRVLLHNDDVHTFDYVIDTIVKVLAACSSRCCSALDTQMPMFLTASRVRVSRRGRPPLRRQRIFRAATEDWRRCRLGVRGGR